MQRYIGFIGAVTVALLLQCCAEKPRQADAVREPETAILIAKDRCFSSLPGSVFDNASNWNTEYEAGVWHVWLGERRECAFATIDVRASDGATPNGCRFCLQGVTSSP